MRKHGGGEAVQWLHVRLLDVEHSEENLRSCGGATEVTQTQTNSRKEELSNACSSSHHIIIAFVPPIPPPFLPLALFLLSSSSNMMLVQKHTLILPMSPTLAHRRNPSAAPAVIVQPTRTPGLLSLSKPPRPSPPHQRQINAQHRQHKALSKPRQQPIASALTQPAADNSISDKPLPLSAAPTTTNPPQSRSRAHAKYPKEKPNNPPRTLTR